METHSIMLGLINKVKKSSILARHVHVQKDSDRHAQHGLSIYLTLHISVFINFYTFCSQWSAFNL